MAHRNKIKRWLLPARQEVATAVTQFPVDTDAVAELRVRVVGVWQPLSAAAIPRLVKRGRQKRPAGDSSSERRVSTEEKDHAIS